MKKRYIILLAVLTAFIISGCKGGKDKDTPAGTEEAVATAESPAASRLSISGPSQTKFLRWLTSTSHFTQSLQTSTMLR